MEASINQLLDLANRLKGLQKELPKLTDSSIRSTFDSVQEDLSLEFSRCVDDFYNEYDPEYYRRTYALYEGYEFDRGSDGLLINWRTDASLIPDWHRASPKYIYDLTYLKGQHGGGINNELYRNGIAGWGKPVIIGVPIDIRIGKSFEQYKKSKKMQSYFDYYFDTNFNNCIRKLGLELLF